MGIELLLAQVALLKRANSACLVLFVEQFFELLLDFLGFLARFRLLRH
jgi:hypothetical protein